MRAILFTATTVLMLAISTEAVANCSSSANITAPWLSVPAGEGGEGGLPEIPFVITPDQNGFCADGKYLYIVGNVPALNTPEQEGDLNHIRRVSSDGSVTVISDAESGLPKGGPEEDQYFTSCDILSDGTMFLRYGTNNAELWMVNIGDFEEFGPLSQFAMMPIFSTDYGTWDSRTSSARGVCDVDSSPPGVSTPFYGSFGNIVQDPATGSLFMIGHFCKAIYRLEVVIPGGLCCPVPEGGHDDESRTALQRKMDQQCLCGDEEAHDDEHDEGPPFTRRHRMAEQCGELGGELEGPPELPEGRSRPMQIQCGGHDDDGHDDDDDGHDDEMEEVRKYRLQRRQKKTQAHQMNLQEGRLELPELPPPSSFFWVAVQVAGQVLDAGTDDDTSEALNARLNEARYAAFFAGNMYFLDTSGLRKFNPTANFGDGSVTTLVNSPSLEGFQEGLNSAAMMNFASATSRVLVAGTVLVINDAANSAVWGVDLSDEENAMSYGLLLSSNVGVFDSPLSIYPMGVDSFAIADGNGLRVVESQYHAMCYESSSSTNVGSLTTLISGIGVTPVPPTPAPAGGGGRSRALDVQNDNKKKLPTSLFEKMQNAGTRHRTRKSQPKKTHRRGLAIQEGGMDSENFAMCTDGHRFYFASDEIVSFTPGGPPFPNTIVEDSMLCQDDCEMITQCDIYGDTMFVSWDGGSVIGRLSLSTGDSFVTPISAHDFDFWGSGREATLPDRCDGGIGEEAKTFGTVGNFIQGGGPTRYYLFGADCGVLWRFDYFPSAETESAIAAGMSVGTDLNPSGPAVDSADPTTARIKGARYGTYHQGSLGDRGRIFFLDQSGLRKFTIGGGVTTLTSSSPTWSSSGYSVGLNSAASLPLSAGGITGWSRLVIRESNQLYLSDPVNLAIWMVDISDDQNIMWGTAVGGWPVKTGSGSTDGPAASAQISGSVMEVMPYRDSLAFLDESGVRTLTGRTAKCAGDVLPTSTSGVCTPATVCSSSSEFETTPKGRFTDRVCSPLTVCGAQEIEITAPTKTSDRVCGPAPTPQPLTPQPETPSQSSTTQPASSTVTVTTTTAASTTTTAIPPPPPTTTANSPTTTTSAATSSSSTGVAEDLLFDPAAPLDGPANAVRADGGLSGGEQAGISLGVILVIVGICCVLGFGIWKYKMSKKKDKSAAENKKTDDLGDLPEDQPSSQPSVSPPVSARAARYSPQETSLFGDV